MLMVVVKMETSDEDVINRIWHEIIDDVSDINCCISGSLGDIDIYIFSKIIF